MSSFTREAGRIRRHVHVRKKVAGVPSRPRLVVYRSHLHLYAQIVDDASGKTLAAASTRHPEFLKQYPKGGNVEAAKKLGELVARAASLAGISTVVFDRAGYLYHGRVKALAEGARATGLEF